MMPRGSMTVKEASTDPVQSCEMDDGTLAVFEGRNSQTYIRGESVEVTR